MKFTLRHAVATIILMLSFAAPVAAARLPGSNSELGCKELNEVMANGMEKGEDFLDCNKQDDKNYIHLKSPESCVKYLIGEYGALFVLNKHGYPPLVPIGTSCGGATGWCSA